MINVPRLITPAPLQGAMLAAIPSVSALPLQRSQDVSSM